MDSERSFFFYFELFTFFFNFKYSYSKVKIIVLFKITEENKKLKMRKQNDYKFISKSINRENLQHWYLNYHFLSTVKCSKHVF